MATSILVSVGMPGEESYNLAVVNVPGTQGDIQCLTEVQLQDLLEQMQPMLQAAGMASFERLKLVYIEDGVPSFEHIWSTQRPMALDPFSVELSPGHTLWLNSTFTGSFETITLKA